MKDKKKLFGWTNKTQTLCQRKQHSAAWQFHQGSNVSVHWHQPRCKRKRSKKKSQRGVAFICFQGCRWMQKNCFELLCNKKVATCSSRAPGTLFCLNCELWKIVKTLNAAYKDLLSSFRSRHLAKRGSEENRALKKKFFSNLTQKSTRKEGAEGKLANWEEKSKQNFWRKIISTQQNRRKADYCCCRCRTPATAAKHPPTILRAFECTYSFQAPLKVAFFRHTACASAALASYRQAFSLWRMKCV